MQTTYIDLPEPMPEPQKRWCRWLASMISLGLRFGAWIIAGIIWYVADAFYALAGLGIGYLAISIVRSKLRLISIPSKQLEYSYTDEAIAKWYVGRYLLCDRF
jgi:hypothetical protein